MSEEISAVMRRPDEVSADANTLYARNEALECELQALRAEHERLQAQFADLESLQRLADFSATVAHDFNNLLTAILSYAELAMLGVPSDTTTGEYLRGVRAAAERGAELTTDLLTRVRARALASRRADCDPTAAAKQ